MAEWQSSALGTLVEVKGGKRLPKGVSLLDKPNSHPYIRIRDLGKSKTLELTTEYGYVDDTTQTGLARYIVNEGDVLLSIVGTIGLTAIVGASLNKANLTENCVRFVNLNGIDAEFLYYYLTSSLGQNEIRKGTVGAVQPKLPIKNIQSFIIRYPSLDYQKQIVSLLKAIDDKTEYNVAINNNLQQQAFTIFDEQFPSYNDGVMIIGDYISPKRGKNLLFKDAVLGEVPVVAGGLEAATYHNVANTVAPVLTISASGANAGFVNLWHTPVWASDSSFIDSAMTKDVFFWFVLLKKRQREIFDSQTGSAQPHIYPQHIAAMRIPTFDKEKIAAYVEQVQPLFTLIGANIRENACLAILRDTLLPKLMSGEIDVSDIEI